MYKGNLEKPKLIEPGVAHFFNENLKLCHSKKAIYMNKLFNVILLCMFLCILFMILYYKYKGKLTPKQKKEKENKERLYILNKVKSMKVEKQKQQQEIITNLPPFDNEQHIVNNILPMTHPSTTPINFEQNYYNNKVLR